MSSLWKTDNPNLSRDPNTGAIINTNIGEYNKMVRARQQAIETQNIANEVNGLKDEIAEIKKLLAQLVNGKH